VALDKIPIGNMQTFSNCDVKSFETQARDIKTPPSNRALDLEKSDLWLFVLDKWLLGLDQWLFVLDQWLFVLDQWLFVLDQWLFV